MAKPWIHSLSSSKRFGGSPEDYLSIHQFLDSSKESFPDNRHRAVLHSTFGCFLAEKVFGITIVNSEGKSISTRDVAEQHILEDFGGRFIPTLQDYLENMEYREWMTAGKGEPPSSHKKIDSATTRTQVMDFRKVSKD